MAKEFLVKGALCMCKFGAAPGKFTIVDQSYFKVNGDKLAGTTLSIGNTFDPPGFGVCKVNPIMPKPCTPAIVQWAKPFTTIRTSMGGNPLTEESTATCASGAPDCISVVQTGQIPVPGVADFQRASSEHQEVLDPMGESAALTEHQIPFSLASNFAQKQSVEEESDEPFEVEIIDIANADFVPLGIPNKQDDKKTDDKIKVSFKIKHSNAKDYRIKIKNQNNNVVYSIFFMQEVIVTPTEQDSPPNPEGYPPGDYVFEWDGFDSDDVYDTTKIGDKLYIQIIGTGMNGKLSSDQKTIDCGKMDVDWMDVKIDKVAKQIDVLLRLDLCDGGTVGLDGEDYNYMPVGGSGMRKVHSGADWDRVPDADIQRYGHPPIRIRTKSFEELKQLFFDGVEKYWSRTVNIKDDQYRVRTTAIHTEENCMDDLKLRYVTNDTQGRSSNPGSATWNPYTWAANFAYQRVYYNVGYIKYSSGWFYRSGLRADNDFKHTAAHEMGHEILKTFGGAVYSYNHKGTSTTLQNTVPNTPYPKAPEEIDLMKYSDDEYIPSDYYDRSVAAEEDVLGMLWLTKIEIR